MRYIENHLAKSERIVAKAKFTSWVYMRDIFTLLVLTAVDYVLFRFVSLVTEQIFWYVFAGIAGLFVLMVLQNTFVRWGTELVLTENKLSGRKGFFSIRLNSVQLVQINNLESTATFFGRIFGYGTVIVNIQDNKYVYKRVARPDAFVNKVNMQIARLRKNEQGENIVIKFGLATDRVKARRRLPMDAQTAAAKQKLDKKKK